MVNAMTTAAGGGEERMGSENEVAADKASGRGKRRRAATLQAAATDSPDSAANHEASHEAKSQTKRSRQKKKKTPPPQSRSMEEWPAYFRNLEKTHRALNVVFTFCCTRKHLLTTFATIKTAVEAHTGGQALCEADVAAVTCLLAGGGGGGGGGGSSGPFGGIRFAYVDELSLQMEVQGAERDDTFKTGATRNERARLTAAGPAADASVGGLTGRQGLEGADDAARAGREVLYFEFVDEDLKREVADRKTGAPTKATRMLRDEKLRMPVYGQAQMTALIGKRNQRFAAAVNSFLDRCAAEGKGGQTDAEAALREAAVPFVPVPTPEAEQTSCQDGEGDVPLTIPTERASIAEIVQQLKDCAWYTGQVVPDGHRVFAAQEAVYGELSFLLSQDVVNALYNAKGITRFYTHQAEAINALHEGQHVVVATSTSSGKSLIYQLPVVQALEEDGQARALYIFPTKALAQDQKRSLSELLAYMPGLDGAEAVATFDGDTPWEAREGIREAARVVFTNPDMLHAAVLPQEGRWRSFLQRLAYVVVDELHCYSGLLGSHVAWILRRLRRVCAAVGNTRLRFVGCSATVANPAEHFAALLGVAAASVHVVAADGSPAGRKEFLCWNTPYRVAGDPSSGRGSGLDECARLFCALVQRGVRVIAFCRVRAQCEKLLGAVQEALREGLGRPAWAERVMAYRGGYTAQDRRRIEADMFAGRLVGIVATTALELGVDIGALDCVLTWGFPYSIAHLRQQSGRAGRRAGRDALAILVGDASPADQFYMQHPDALFDQGLGALQVDLDNVLVREGHLQCAAYEMPVRPAEDAAYLGPGLAALCAERLEGDDLGFYHCHARFRPQPWKQVAIRGGEDEQFAIVDIGRDPPVVLEELEAERATFSLYDGAIFLHQGTTYLVQDFCPERRMARVRRVRVDWLTQQRDYTDVDAVETQAVRRIGGDSDRRAYLGRIRITQVVFGYFKVDRRERILDAVQVDNPPIVRHSRGTWVDVPAAGLAVLARRRLHAAAAIHAAEHAVLGLLPSVVISLPGDVRTECKSHLKEFQKRDCTRRQRPARLTFYDARGGPGGTGLAAKAFDFIDLLLAQALQRIEGCICGLAASPRGCPECVSWPQCSESNTVTSKAGAVVVLRSLLGLPIDEAALPMGPEEGIPPGPETIVLAQPVPGVRDGEDRGDGGDGDGDGDCPVKSRD